MTPLLEGLSVLGVVVAYVALARWVLPGFGVGT